MSTTSGLPTEEPKTTKQKILEAGASLLQSKQPIKAFKQHLMSVSSLAGEPTKQFLLHHFVNTFNEDFAQALLYDGDLADSKLVGIQYIVSDKVYLTLPEEERKLWYPLQYMVRNGLLVAPSLPAMAEKPLMARLLASYSKTFLFWQTGLNPLPVGIPQILSSISTDGQVNKTLSTNLLDTAKIELADLMKRREAIDSNPVLPGAPHSHEVYQLFLQRVGGPQNQNQMGGLGSNYPSGISETYGETPLTGTHTTGTPLTGTSGLTGRSYDTSSPSTEIYTASGLAGATAAGAGAYGASRLTDTHHTSSPHTTTPLTGTSGLTGRSYDTSTPLTGTTYATSTTPLTEAERIRLTEHTTIPSTGTHTHTTTPGYTHTTTPGTSGYTHTTPLAGTSGYTHTTPLAGTSGYTHTTTPSTGTYTTGTTPLSGTTYGTTGTTNTPLTEAERNRLTGTNHPAAVSHQAAVDNVAAGLLGGEHGHAPKRDVVTSTNLPGSTSSAAYPYHTSTSTSTDYTAQ